jgi:hypothetical protein
MVIKQNFGKAAAVVVAAAQEQNAVHFLDIFLIRRFQLLSRAIIAAHVFADAMDARITPRRDYPPAAALQRPVRIRKYSSK